MRLEVGYMGETWGTVELDGSKIVCSGSRLEAIKGMVAEFEQRHPNVSSEQLLAIMLDSPQSYVWVREKK